MTTEVRTQNSRSQIQSSRDVQGEAVRGGAELARARTQGLSSVQLRKRKVVMDKFGFSMFESNKLKGNVFTPPPLVSPLDPVSSHPAAGAHPASPYQTTDIVELCLNNALKAF
jgi:hypothetical protein